jgi:GrpB-like predicted nucleotidyltransferase (UPF0157 family)
MKRQIEIVPYNSHWPEEFERIASAIRDAMGDLALRIDHIGSTSVPGLAAKDIIDIQLTVRELDVAAISKALATIGYTRPHGFLVDHIPPGADEDPDQWTKLMFKPPEGQRRMHLHVRQQGRANQRYPLLFRDYLRANPNAAEAYSRVKVALARLHPGDIDAYYDVKDPVCDLIIDAANLWLASQITPDAIQSIHPEETHGHGNTTIPGQ